jgi:hypothetical protein
VTLLARARAEVRAPHGLRTRIDAARPARRARRTARALYGGASATALAALALALVLILPSGAPGGPTLSQAAALGSLAPTAAGPAPDSTNRGERLRGEVEDVYFPNWGSLHWRAVGQRVDRIEGRVARTVYYQWRHYRIAYTIVGAPALSQPRAPVAVVHGTVERTIKLGGRTVVTWQRSGHTCVLSGARLNGATLRALAAWRAPGALAA